MTIRKAHSVLIRYMQAKRYTIMSDQRDYSGMAALSICESLLLALNDHKILPESEIIGVLKDAANTHENATGPDTSAHKAAATLINRIISGGNSVRRPQ
jgi:hypothetical protein